MQTASALFAPQLYMPSGELQLNNSANAIVTASLFNSSGLIDGSGGQVEASVLNSGTISSASVGGSFTFTGSGNTSSGTILISTGTLHFSHDLTNQAGGLISMTGGDFLIDGGLTNNNDLEVLGNSTVFGAVTNSSSAGSQHRPWQFLSRHVHEQRHGELRERRAGVSWRIHRTRRCWRNRTNHARSIRLGRLNTRDRFLCRQCPDAAINDAQHATRREHA